MAMTRGNVVIGEAPESDSEDELNISDGVAVGNAVPGEAPESDDEAPGKSGSLDSISSAMSASSFTTDKPKIKITLLSRKLRERNVSLVKNLRELVGQAVTSANCELQTTDQHILDCQMKLQEAECILRSINLNVASLDKKLTNIIISKYIPDIQV